MPLILTYAVARHKLVVFVGSNWREQPKRYPLSLICFTLERITIWSGHLVFGIRCKRGCSVVVALTKSQITVQSKSGYALERITHCFGRLLFLCTLRE